MRTIAIHKYIPNGEMLLLQETLIHSSNISFDIYIHGVFGPPSSPPAPPLSQLTFFDFWTGELSPNCGTCAGGSYESNAKAMDYAGGSSKSD